MVTRQTLARYAFFEEARGSTSHSEDALIPLVLPSIAGRAGRIFSPDELGRDLIEIFGPDLASSLAASLVDPLIRQGYLRREVVADQGVVLAYTEKLAQIPLEASISHAEQDLEAILSAFDEFMAVTPQISPLKETRAELSDHIVNWMTTLESSEIAEGVALVRAGASPKAVAGQPYEDLERAALVPDRLRLLFSSFVSWLSREREDTFEKILTFVELGLVVDLVSEIRVPTRRKAQVSLTVVLDSRLIMELVGLYGPQSEASIRRLLELCRTHGVNVVTMVHLVDEMNEVIHNTILNPTICTPGSISEAMQRHPDINSKLNAVYKAPDRFVRDAGVGIYQYSQAGNANAERLFTSEHIGEFQALLPYGQEKVNMRKRDAWTLAYAVRRQNGVHTSNVYDARCIILTRSFPFVDTARRYLKSDAVGYPGYAVAPIMELRHFSTLFMLSFGTGAARPVVRAELIASCDRIVRVSPTLTHRIRTVLGKIKSLPSEQLEAALADPGTMAEFALVTGNDPDLVTDQNSAALVAVIKGAATKEAELRHRAADAQREARHQAELYAKERLIFSEREERSLLESSLKRQADEVAQMRHESERKDDLLVYATVRAIRREVSIYWFAVLVVAAAGGAGFFADYLFHVGGIASAMQIAAGTFLGLFAGYMALASFWSAIAPNAMRGLIMRLVARRQLRASIRPDLNPRVLAFIAPDSALQMPAVALIGDPAFEGELRDRSSVPEASDQLALVSRPRQS